MPRRPQKAKRKDGKYNVTVVLPGWLKNDLIAHCAKKKVSLNEWLVNRIYNDILEDRGIPEPPQARAPIPTPADQIRAWAMGEKLTMPCGQTSCDMVVEEVGTAGYCKTCRIRVR